MVLKAEVSHFSVVLPHLRSEYDRLKELGIYEPTGKANRFRWTFPLKYLKEVQIALGGRVVQFDKEHLYRRVIKHCDPLLRDLELQTEKQGKCTITITTHDLGYRVSWLQSGKLKSFVVSKEMVELQWSEVYCKFRLGEEVASAVVWEKIVRALECYHWDYPLMEGQKENEELKGIIRRGRWRYKTSGRFNSKHFFGDRIAGYTRIFYNPVKVLVALGLVQHGGSGVTRIAEKGELNNQARITEIMMIEEARLHGVD